MRIIVIFPVSLGFRDDSPQMFLVPPPGIADTVGDVLVAFGDFFKDEPWWPPSLVASDLGFASCQGDCTAKLSSRLPVEALASHSDQPDVVLRLCFRCENRRSGVGEPPESWVSAVVHKTKLCSICLTEKSRHDFSVQAWKSKVSCVCRSCNINKQQEISDTAASRQLAAGELVRFSSPGSESDLDGGATEEEIADAEGTDFSSGSTLSDDDASSGSEGGCISDAFAHWSLYWHHVEALEIADKFSSGQIDDAELLSQRFGLEEKLEVLQRVDYDIFAYAGAYYGKKVNSWHCDCDHEGMEMARHAWCVH